MDSNLSHTIWLNNFEAVKIIIDDAAQKELDKVRGVRNE